jgi:hypothetical protein
MAWILVEHNWYNFMVLCHVEELWSPQLIPLMDSWHVMELAPTIIGVLHLHWIDTNGVLSTNLPGSTNNLPSACLSYGKWPIYSHSHLTRCTPCSLRCLRLKILRHQVVKLWFLRCQNSSGEVFSISTKPLVSLEGLYVLSRFRMFFQLKKLFWIRKLRHLPGPVSIEGPMSLRQTGTRGCSWVKGCLQQIIWRYLCRVDATRG